jgi:hypothetical protein
MILVTRAKMNRVHNRRIHALINFGVLEHPSELPCFHCGERATSYHHFRGYGKGTELLVIPLCHSCHQKVGWALGEKRFTERMRSANSVRVIKARKRAAEVNREKFLRIHEGHDFYYSGIHTRHPQMVCRTCKKAREEKSKKPL